MNRQATLLLLALTLTACSGSTGNGLDPNAQTLVSGDLRVFDAAAPQHARIVLLDDAGARLATSELDAQSGGTFRLAAPRPGHVRFLAQDDQGHVATGSWNLQQGGENKVGRIWLMPATDAPELVTLHGFGLEERMSTFDHPEQPLSYALTTPGLVAVDGDLFRVDPDGGEASALAPGPAFMLGVSFAQARPSIALASLPPCWATSWLNRSPFTVATEPLSVTFFDVEQGRPLFTVDLEDSTLTGVRRLLDATCSDRELVVLVAEAGSLYALRTPRGGATERVELGAWGGSNAGFAASVPGTSVLVAYDSTGLAHVQRWRHDSAALEPEHVFSTTPTALSSDGETVVIWKWDGITWGDLDTGEEHPMEGVPPHCHLINKGDVVAVSCPSADVDLAQAFRFDLRSRQTQALDLSPVAGDLAQCRSGDCALTIGPAGQVVAFRPNFTYPGPAGFVFDTSSGQLLRYPDVAGLKDAYLWITGSGRLVLGLYTQSDIQLWSAEQGSFRQRTFLPGSLESVQLEGERAYYVRTDPLSGLSQLFRVDLADAF